MLLVNAKKGSSKIHELGLISCQFIPKGTRIWQLQPEFDVIMTPEKLETLSPSARAQMLYYCYYDPQKRLYILSSDDDRFTNHSETPNSALDHDGTSTVAIVDIAEGDEITWDYRNGANWHLGSDNLDQMPHEYIFD